MQRIVVIDDEPAVRQTLGIVLKRAGYEVLLAASGTEGIGLCGETRPDLVITDIHMPGADGFETIASLRAVHPGLPVIAISGGDQTTRLGLLGSAELLGTASTLKKPFGIHELLGAVRQALAAGPTAGES